MLFWWFFFCNVTKHYEFCNDTCFLSVRLRNLTGHVITLFLAFGMLRNITDCITMLPFDFRHVMESHGLCNNASFWSPACHGTSRIVQQWVPSTLKWPTKGCMPSNNSPQTKLRYDICSSLLAFYRRKEESKDKTLISSVFTLSVISLWRFPSLFLLSLHNTKQTQTKNTNNIIYTYT